MCLCAQDTHKSGFIMHADQYSTYISAVLIISIALCHQPYKEFNTMKNKININLRKKVLLFFSEILGDFSFIFVFE